MQWGNIYNFFLSLLSFLYGAHLWVHQRLEWLPDGLLPPAFFGVHQLLQLLVDPLHLDRLDLDLHLTRSVSPTQMSLDFQ